MTQLLSLAAIVAFDPVEDFKVPCMIVEGGWDYYTKLQILVFLPLVVAALLSLLTFGIHMTRAHFKHKREASTRRRRVTRDAAVTGSESDLLAMHAAAYRSNMRSSARRALETCVSLVGMLMDFAFPVCSRTVLQIFRCRELGNAGFFLEADYSLRCYDSRWNAWMVLAAPAVLLYAVGIPLGFWLLVRRFKRLGKLDDPDVKRMIGWMYRPFREGKEYWLAVELIRKLILTACIGFMARSCHYKLLPVEFLQKHFFRVNCTATARSLISAQCSAIL